MKNTLGCLILDRASIDAARLGTVDRCLRRRLGQQGLLTWILRRASEAQQLRELVVVVSPEVQLSEVRAAIPANVRIHESRAADTLARVRECVAEAGRLGGSLPRGIVNLRLNCPLLDPCLLDRLVMSVEGHPEVDYATFCSRTGASVMSSPVGLFADYISTKALDTLARRSLSSSSRNDFVGYITSHPELFLLRLIPLPAPLDRNDVRLSLRHPDDWEHAEQIVEALGHDHLDWQQIISLLDRQPTLRARMAKLNFEETRA